MFGDCAFQDKYILTSMGILCGVCMWHSVVPLMEANLHLAVTADRCALIILGSGYFMFHVVFFLYIYFVVSERGRVKGRRVDII